MCVTYLRMPRFNSIIVILSLLKPQPHRLCFPTTSQPVHDPRLHSPVTRLGAHYLFYLHILHTAGPSSCRPSCITWLPAGSKSSALTAHLIVVPWLLKYTDMKRTRNMGLQKNISTLAASFVLLIGCIGTIIYGIGWFKLFRH